MITLIAKLGFKPGEGEKFVLDFPAKAARIRDEEPGVLLYKLCQVRGAVDEYRMVEAYASQQALDEHMARLRESGSSLADKLTAPPEIEILDDLHPQ